MKAFDKDVQDRLQELTELYPIVKEIVIYSEENDPKDKKKPLIATLDRYDANYLLLMAMLTLGYMTERLRKSIETT
jgi:hypothetical protein